MKWGLEAQSKNKRQKKNQNNKKTKDYLTQDGIPEGKVGEISEIFRVFFRGQFRFDIVFSSPKEELQISHSNTPPTRKWWRRKRGTLGSCWEERK